MNLKKLIDQRTKLEKIALPISDTELCRRYEGVTTAMVNDVLREKNYLYQTLPNNIKPLSPDMKVAGIAFTVKGSKNLDIADEMQQRAKMLENIETNSVVCWDTSEDNESAQWGEVMTMASIRRGCVGAIVDGGVRDTDMVLSQKFPVFCKYTTSNGMMGRFRMIGYQVPINIGGVHIYPGDIVFGDIDGCIIVPRCEAYEVLIRAEEIKTNEKEIKNMIIEGLSPTEVVKNGGYF